MFNYRQEDASGDMGVGAGCCGGKVCSLLRKTIYICIVCTLGFQWWCWVGSPKRLSNKLAKHLNVTYLTYTGGKATPRTASWPNTSNSSATLKRGNKEEEEKSGQSELHLWNSAAPSSGQLVPVGTQVLSCQVREVHGVDIFISVPCQYPLVY